MEEMNQIVLGIDDAGRGPVIGPMVLSGCIISKQVEEELKELGVADSKTLTRKKREMLENLIHEKSIGWSTKMATPAEIDTGMGIGLNLNQVEAMMAAAIITELVNKLSEEQKNNLRIVIDCPSNNTEGWKAQLLGYLEKKKLNISCEHKADRDHISVGAGSILSKVTRDKEVDKLKEKIGIDFGSGYPSDPKTKAFLEKHVHDFKEERIFRESWATFQNAKEGKKQAKLPDY